MKRDLAAAYSAKRRKVAGKQEQTDLDLEPRESKANLFSNEEMYESPFQLEPMSDDQELAEQGMTVESRGDNTKGNASLEEIMRKIRMRNMRG